MNKLIVIGILSVWSICLFAQTPNLKKKRLDFARTYFEYGGNYSQTFTGKRLLDEKVISFEQPASISQYLTWGAFHFWGHAEFYVTIPLANSTLTKNKETDYQLIHSVATGARIYPWAMKTKTLKPYLGLHWGALDFKQIIKPEENQPTLSKDFLVNYEVGLAYLNKNLGFRLAVNYFQNNDWNYPISKFLKEKITTPAYAIKFGLMYSFDMTKSNKEEITEEWNSFPQISKLSYNASRFGDFFLGLGPSTSYSLKKSTYNQTHFPYLKDKMTSKNYFDIVVGYQFNKWNLFTAISYRNPTFETEGYGTKQTIKKQSITLEMNKFLTDYTGFAPYIGLNVAYDQIKYSENENGTIKEAVFRNKIEPGLTFGWDIVPGKTSEALLLRTNLRWYPYSAFEIDQVTFNFSQLEYNLIQVVFYSGRLKKNKNQTSF